jgi:ABC-type phosphate transport system substrate-binding protein
MHDNLIQIHLSARSVFLNMSAVVFLLLAMRVSYAEGVVVVSPQNTQEIDSADIRKIFLGKKTVFANGQKIKPIALDDNSAISEQFNLHVIKKNKRQLKAYWAKNIFTGKGNPPPTATAREIIEWIKDDPGIISYMENEDARNASLRIIQSF